MSVELTENQVNDLFTEFKNYAFQRFKGYEDELKILGWDDFDCMGRITDKSVQTPWIKERYGKNMCNGWTSHPDKNAINMIKEQRVVEWKDRKIVYDTQIQNLFMGPEKHIKSDGTIYEMEDPGLWNNFIKPNMELYEVYMKFMKKNDIVDISEHPNYVKYRSKIQQSKINNNAKMDRWIHFNIYQKAKLLEAQEKDKEMIKRFCPY